MMRFLRLALICVLWLASSAFAEEKPFADLLYRWGDSPWTEAGTPEWSLGAPEGEDWKPFHPGDQDQGRQGNYLWYAFRLDGSLRSPVAVIEMSSGAYEIYVQGRRISHWGDIHRNDRSIMTDWRGISDVQPLPANARGWVYLRFHSTLARTGLYAPLRVVEHSEALARSVREGFARMAAGLVAIGFGMVQLLLFLGYRARTRLYALSGLFMLVTGGHMFITSLPAPLIVTNTSLLCWIDVISVYSIPLFFLWTILGIFQPRPRALFVGLIAFNAGFLVLASLMYAWQLVPLYGWHPFYHNFLMVQSAFSLVYLVVMALRGNRDAAIFALGFLAQVIAMFYDLLHIHQRFFGSDVMISHLGMLAWGLSPAVILLRRFVKSLDDTQTALRERDAAFFRLEALLQMTKAMALESSALEICADAANVLRKEWGNPVLEVDVVLAPELLLEHGHEAGLCRRVRLTLGSGRAILNDERCQFFPRRAREWKDSVLYVPVELEGRWLAELALHGAPMEDAVHLTFLEAVVSPLSISLERIRLDLDEKRHGLRLSALISGGREIAKQTSLPGIVRQTVAAMTDLAGRAMDGTRVYFSHTCFMREKLSEGFYRVGDGGAALPESMCALAGANGLVIPVHEPRNQEVIAFLALDEAAQGTLAPHQPSFEILATNVASAVSSVLLQDLFGLLDKKSRDMKTILDCIEEGICLIDENLCVLDEKSRHLTRLVPEVGSGAAELTRILETVGLAGDTLQRASSALFASLGESVISWKANLKALPTSAEKGEPGNENYHYFALGWVPVLDDSDTVTRVMLTIRELTELKLALLSERRMQEHVSRFHALMSADLLMMERFMELAGTGLDAVRSFGGVSAAEREPKLASLRRVLHTVKGNARRLRLQDVADVVHLLENHVCRPDFGHKPPGDGFAELVERLNGIIADYARILEELLSVSQGHQSKISSRVEEILKHSEQILSLTGDPALRALVVDVQRLGMGIVFDALSELVCELEAHAAELACDLQKPAPRFELRHGGGIFLQRHCAQRLREALIHLVRNSMDHGLRGLPEDRIFLAAAEENGQLVLDYWGTERGLWLARLREKAKSLNFSYSSDEELAVVIFSPGVSTAERVSDVSGRGIGMDAVRDTIEGMGGHIGIEFTGSENDEGRRPFRFRIILPGNVLARML